MMWQQHDMRHGKIKWHFWLAIFIIWKWHMLGRSQHSNTWQDIICLKKWKGRWLGRWSGNGGAYTRALGARD